MYAFHLKLVGKLMVVNFMLAITERFSLTLTAEDL